MSTTLDLGRIIRRDALLERLTMVRPHIVALVAPAGFGKSTLARQFLEGQAAFAVCECAHVEDDLDFARRIVPALAEEDPQRGAALSQRELLLGDGAMSSSERVALALNAWRTPIGASTFVLENAEHIAASHSAREFLIRLLAERPSGRTIVICSRESVHVHLSRFAAPHHIVTLRGDDLAFSREELEQIFAPLDLGRPMLDRIYGISQGWPVPVLFIARLAAEGRHETVLDRLGDVAFEELYEYLADQVIDALPPVLTRPLFAAACIPNATAQDLVLATDDPCAGELLAEFERTSPFVTSAHDDAYVVHPLMRAMLIEGAGARRDQLLGTTAHRYEGIEDYLRAAELHLARPDPEAAAQALECVPVGEDRAPSMRYSRMVAALDRTIVRRYPTLWSCSALLQTFCADSDQLLEETGTLWATLTPQTPLNKRYYVLATRVLLLTYLGMFDEALALLEAVAPRAAIPDPPVAREHGYALYLHATVIARLGRLDEAERDIEQGWPLIEPMDVMASAALMIRGAEIERARGNATKEREFLEQSLEYARRSQLSNVVAFRLAEATFGAWLAGDERTFARHSAELEEIVQGDGIRGIRYFSMCARGQYDSEPRPADLLRWALCGHLIAACEIVDDALALHHANAARALTARYPVPFLRAVTAVVCAELGPAHERTAAYDDARAIAESMHAAELLAAVNAASEERADGGMLGPFLTRIRSRRNVRTPRLEISVLEGSVRCGGREVKLAERELELLFALARRREAVTREELAELLWPDRDEDSTRNLLKVHLHRLRGHLGDDEAIERTRDGLRLCEDAQVDIWEFEGALSVRHAGDIGTEAERDALMAIHVRFAHDLPKRLLAWEWFAPVERMLRELRCEVARRLARYALAQGRNDEALDLAHDMIQHDACDEAAREIAIEAHMQKGDRASALRTYRQYRDVLFAELQCDPSASLREMLHR
ncbi:MAG: hypothetical protein NVSMB64_13310 [Candidatus Velthaea sp.]